MRRADRRAIILDRAREMARTGAYRSWETIALHLHADGFFEAREILDDPSLRQELDGYCRTASDRGSGMPDASSSTALPTP